MWPILDFTTYWLPKYLLIVLALAGDSTMTSDLPMEREFLNLEVNRGGASGSLNTRAVGNRQGISERSCAFCERGGSAGYSCSARLGADQSDDSRP